MQVRPQTWAAGQSVFSIVFRVLHVWLFVSTEGSLLAVVPCHAACNTAWQLFPVDGSAFDPWIAAAITGVLAAVLTLASGRACSAPAPSKRFRLAQHGVGWSEVTGARLARWTLAVRCGPSGIPRARRLRAVSGEWRAHMAA